MTRRPHPALKKCADANVSRSCHNVTPPEPVIEPASANTNTANRPADANRSSSPTDLTRLVAQDDPASELANVLDQYLDDLQAGRQPDRQRLLTDHPELASQLEQCLAGIEFIHQAATPAVGAPTRLGDFRILSEVGRGGMGVVYEAEQISLKRRVALKVLRYGAAADNEAMQRFQREAETVATLHHTNIVPIFAIGCEQGVNYYAMQFIEGWSLNVAVSLRETNAARRSTSTAQATLERQSPSTSGSANVSRSETATMVANWGLQAAEALAHAHQRGVIHRDIKPSNLILDPDGRIWLTDFGLAKRMDDVSLSMAGAILGTPRYMSPEQAAASKNSVDHRTDIYSLGATLYELATGRPLFEADSPHAVITQILTSEPRSPRVVCPNLHRDFETIILKCLAKEPERRYATAQTLADDLRAFVEGRAIRARRSTLAEQAARWFKQQKRSVGVAAGAVAATVLIVVGSLIAWQMHTQSRLGYLTLNTPRDGAERAEVAEVLSLKDEPVGAPFTLPTKEPIALPEGAYRLRLTAPSKVSQSYLFDVAAGAQQTHEVGLVNETVGYPIPLRSPVGVELWSAVARHSFGSLDAALSDEVNATDSATTKKESRSAAIQSGVEPPHSKELRLFVGPQDSSKPTLRCYSVASQPPQRVVHEGTSSNVSQSIEPQPLWEANWSLDAPDIISFLKLPADREAWKVLPAQTDVFAWQQVLAWFDPSWLRNGTPPKVLQPARDLNGDGVEDVIWVAPTLSNQATGAFGPGPLTPKAAVLVAASGKDGKPLWWFRPQDSKGAACRLGTAPVWCGDVIVSLVRSVHDTDSRIEAVSPTTGDSLWRHNAGAVGWSWMTTATIDGTPSVIAVIQDRLFVLDVATGEPKLGTPAYLDWSESGKIVVKPEDSTGLHKGNVLLADLRFAELDGDGVPEVLLSVFVQDQRVDVVALSLARREALWQVSSSVKIGPHDPYQGSLPWPFVADFDDDGRAEVIVPNHSGYQIRSWTGCRVLKGATGELRWERRFPVKRAGNNIWMQPDRYVLGPDLDRDGIRELFMASVRSEYGPVQIGSAPAYHRERNFLYVDCFSGRDGASLWWQRIPIGMSEYSTWTADPETPIWWQRDEHSWPKLVLPVRRRADQGGDGIGNASARLLFVLSAETGRVEHAAENLALPQLVDWNNDGLDDLAVYVPDDPQEFANPHNWPYKPSGKFVVLRGSPPEALRRLDRWTEEQDFDGDGIAELSKRHDGSMGRMGDFAVLIASGRDGRLMTKWKTEWPETPHEFTVGNVQSFPPPLGDFDGDGLADLLISREQYNWDFERGPLVKTGQAPLLMQAISSKTGQRIWGGVPLPLPDWLRPKNADENSQDWMPQRNGRLHPVSTQAVDLDADGRPEVLQAMRLVGYRQSEHDSTLYNEHQQPFVALIDGSAGTLGWCEPIAESVAGNHSPGLDYLRIDASTDLNGDGTRDLVLTVPNQSPQHSWSLSLQVHSGRDGKVLWGPKATEGTSFNNNDFNLPIVSDLDGDGRPEIVLMPTNQPHVTVLRGDTGEPLWTWKGSQPPNFAAPGIAVVASRLGTPARPDADATTEDKDRTGKSAHSTKRCVAVAFNETGSQWDIAWLDHEGKLLERIPCGSNQLWSQDLDGDGAEELLRYVDTKLTASRGLHDVLWTWNRPQSDYGWVSHFDRTPDGRAIVVTASSDSLTLLDGTTGKPLGRTWKSSNTSSHDGHQLLNVKQADNAKRFENSRLLTRVGDGPQALHVVSRAVLPTDEDGRFQRSRHAPRDEPNASLTSNSKSGSIKSSTSTARSAHHAERDGYVDDPRLVRQLMWATTPEQWAATRAGIFKEVLLAIGLSLIVVLIPYWLIRAGIRRRDLGRWRFALIGCGVILFLGSPTLLRFTPPGAKWRDLPWALPFVMAIGGLPILMFPTALLQALVGGEWRRVRWLLGSTLILALVLAALHLAVDLSNKPPEQHYSWFGWWWIFVMGAYFTGAGLVAWRGIRTGIGWLWNIVRKRYTRHA